MTQIAYILLCHKDADAIIAQAELLTSEGDCIAIHFDKRADATAYARITEALGANPRVTFAKRVRCGWGEWSLVEASLNTLRAAIEAFPEATHFYLLSGDCMPIKPRAYMDRLLAAGDRDFIEHNDFFESDWIKTGIKEERLIYRHHFNERQQKGLFYASMEAQRRLGMERPIPDDVRIFIGSQWWVLRRATVEKVLAFVAERQDVIRFFRTTWIPDETFFQSVVMHVVAKTEVESRTLTYLDFSDYGMPVVFYADHFELLRTQDHLFARKIAGTAGGLRQKLAELYQAKDEEIETGDTANALYRYITRRGRIGRRFTQRFWEDGGNIGRAHELLLVVCKKWHVGQRFIGRLSEAGIGGTLGYIFDDPDCALPDMGNLESSREKRGRHRRAFLKLLFTRTGSDRLIVCLDPSNIDVIRDFEQDECPMRVLEIKCQVSDGYLLGHAERVGLIAVGGHQGIGATLVATLRREFRDESEALLDLNLARLHHLREDGSDAQNAHAVAGFLDMPVEDAAPFARRDGLFD
ncbi:MAG: DUF5928 domain-containing protein [Pseudomonadota bacterium]